MGFAAIPSWLALIMWAIFSFLCWYMWEIIFWVFSFVHVSFGK